MRTRHMLAMLVATAFSGTAEAKDLYCPVYNGTSLLGVPIRVTDADTCRAIAEAAQHAGLSGAS
jgi:hypothetical protein